MRDRTCCFTGHRKIPSEQYTQIARRLRCEIVKLIEQGYAFFGTGGALGFDTLAAQTVLELRESYPQIKLILVLPCKNQTHGWDAKDIAIYEEIKKRCDKFVYTSDADILLAKALLYHNAEPLWESDDVDDEELSFAHNLYGRGISDVLGSKYSSPSRVTFVRTGTLNRLTKERVTIYMPEILAAQPGRNIAKVSVTCISRPPVDRTKGGEYLGAYIRASLKKSHPDGHLLPVQPDFKEGRKKWDICHQFSKMFSSFNAGDWQIWLELFSRWDNENMDVPYALVATIEDIGGTLDVYNEIKIQNRFRSINDIRIKIDT